MRKRERKNISARVTDFGRMEKEIRMENMERKGRAVNKRTMRRDGIEN